MALMEEKHRQILDAAVAVFQDLGYACTSMDCIAARANVSKRTVYNHFENKEALFRAILDLMAEQASPALDITYDPGRDIRQQLVELGWGEGKLLTSPAFMGLARLVVGEIIRDPVLAGDMNSKLDKVAVFQKFMAAAGSDGAIAVTDTNVAGEQFLGLIKSRAFWPFIFSGQTVTEDQMERIVQETVDFFMKSHGK